MIILLIAGYLIVGVLASYLFTVEILASNRSKFYSPEYRRISGGDAAFIVFLSLIWPLSLSGYGLFRGIKVLEKAALRTVIERENSEK